MNDVSNSIGWCHYTVNPVKGLCPVGCSYCYARAMYRRFKLDPTIRYEPVDFNAIPKLKKPSRIFVGSTMELFGPWIDPEWMRLTLEAAKRDPQHTFIFLTKFPERLQEFDWPANCWVGATVTDQESADELIPPLLLADAKVRFLSIEPMLGPVNLWEYMPSLDWVIIGARTQPLVLPEKSWVRQLVESAQYARVPVYMKTSLWKLYPEGLWQQWPEVPRG